MKELVKPLVWKAEDDSMIAIPTDGMHYEVYATEGGYSLRSTLGDSDMDNGESAIALAEAIHEELVLSLLKTVKPIAWTCTDTTSGQADVANPMVLMFNGYTPVEMFTIEVYEEGTILLYDSIGEVFVESVEHGKELAAEWHLSRLKECFE